MGAPAALNPGGGRHGQQERDHYQPAPNHHSSPHGSVVRRPRGSNYHSHSPACVTNIRRFIVNFNFAQL
jgi:hypothetical protein